MPGQAKRTKWRAVAAAGVAALAIGGAGCGGDDESGSGAGGGGGNQASGTVTMLLPENVVARWEGQDKKYFTEAMRKYAPNVKVEALNALNDQSKQQSQAETALTKGTKALVVVAVDQKSAARIVNQAKQQNVPLVAYDRLIKVSEVAA